MAAAYGPKALRDAVTNEAGPDWMPCLVLSASSSGSADDGERVELCATLERWNPLTKQVRGCSWVPHLSFEGWAYQRGTFSGRLRWNQPEVDLGTTTVSLRDLERARGFLRHAITSMARHAMREGEPETFGEALARFSMALGSVVVVEREREGQPWTPCYVSEWDAFSWRCYDGRDMRARVRRIFDAWMAEHPEEVTS